MSKSVLFPIKVGIRWNRSKVWDCIIIGNALPRGNPLVEKVLTERLPFTSGPQWLRDEVLTQREVIAISGTHGKTTTTGMLAWILENAALFPGFLLGGLAKKFSASARFGKTSAPFVIEADEYDTAFFDKRPKFIHYYPRVAVLNNLEFDHADIYPDIRAVQRQFHYFLRTVPSDGMILYRAADSVLQEVINEGVWTPIETFGIDGGGLRADWTARLIPDKDSNRFAVFYRGKEQGVCRMNAVGKHNVENALAAIAAAYHAQVDVACAINALEFFTGVSRRLEVEAEVSGVTVYNDFAHHPTAIAASLQALKQYAAKGRLLAVFEPRSNSMRAGAHRKGLVTAFVDADQVFMYQSGRLDWSPAEVLPAAQCFTDTKMLLESVCAEARDGDCIIVMSNGAFDNLPTRISERLSARMPH